MKLDRFIRLSVGVLVLLVFVIAIAAMLFVTESALNVWDRLIQGPRLLLYGYVSVMALISIAATWVVFNLVVRRKPKRHSDKPVSYSRSDIEKRLREGERAGVDVAGAQAELAELAERQSSSSVHLCFFGEISSGKSSLIKALVPDAQVAIDVTGGSTDDIRHYRWQNEEGTEILLTDVPGTAALEEQHGAHAEEEAQRAQAVIFITEGDLTRAEKKSLQWLLAIGKPLILVMNKSDRFSPEEQAQLMQRLLDHLADLDSDLSNDRVVAVSAGGEAEVIEKRADGSEQVTRRSRPADIGVLVVAINRLIGRNSDELDSRRDRAVFSLAADKLAESEARYREQRAEQIIRSSTRKAVLGALAAVSPGTDVIIQGYIGAAMTRELCALYGAAPRDIDVAEFLNLSQSRAGKVVPLSLAVAGNGLKAFPGIGTVAGGIAHAVAYGLIFDALGHSLVLTLQQHGELDPARAAQEFEDGFSEHIQAGVRQVAKIALDKEREQT